MTFKLSNTLQEGTISNFLLRYSGNVMDRTMYAAFLLLCSVLSSDHKIWLTKTRNSQLRQTGSVPSISVFYLQWRQEIVGVAFCHPVSPCSHPDVLEIVKLDVLEGAFLSLLFKGTYFMTNKLWNPFHRNFHCLLWKGIFIVTCFTDTLLILMNLSVSWYSKYDFYARIFLIQCFLWGSVSQKLLRWRLVFAVSLLQVPIQITSPFLLFQCSSVICGKWTQKVTRTATVNVFKHWYVLSQSLSVLSK